jgi:hypothetical protein
MLARMNWTTKEDFYYSERRALWFYNEVKDNICSVNKKESTKLKTSKVNVG